MKRLISIILALLALAQVRAALPARLQKAADRLGSAPAVKATFTTADGSPGVMTLCGHMFLLVVPGAQMSYDGATQWALSEADEELTLVTPTADELAQCNPLLLLQTAGSRFQAAEEGLTYRLTPRRDDGSIDFCIIRFASASAPWPSEMTLSTGGNQISLTNLKFTELPSALPAAHFRIKAPQGVYINDLR